MRYEQFRLRENRSDVTLTAYLLDRSPEMAPDRKRPGVLVCPGGAYLGCSDREGEPVALAFSAMGYHTFVLRYSTYSGGGFDGALAGQVTEVKTDRIHPAPVQDLGLAMKTLYEHSEEWNLDSSRIAVCGFSAGGHNAAMYGAYWNHPMVTEAAGGSYPAAAVILGYALTDYTYVSRVERGPELGVLYRAMNLAFTGTETPDESLLDELSPARHAGPQFPPAFLWAAADDGMVPVESTLAMAQALSDSGVPFEAHIFERGNHGLALATQATAANPSQIADDAAKWVPLADTWLKKRFSFIE